jgi:phosphoribosylamine--glycine ligase
MMRLQSDLTALCEAAIDGTLDQATAQWDARAALGVVMASGGYPDAFQTGEVISGLAIAAGLPGKVFHAATLAQGDQILTNGGRVLCAVGLGNDVRAAQAEAYGLVGAIHWNLVQYRRDIGYRAIAREQAPPNP